MTEEAELSDKDYERIYEDLGLSGYEKIILTHAYLILNRKIADLDATYSNLSKGVHSMHSILKHLNSFMTHEEPKRLN